MNSPTRISEKKNTGNNSVLSGLFGRIRVQISAAHEHEHLDKCIEAFKKVRKEIEG